jgi:hypothetical protein
MNKGKKQGGGHRPSIGGGEDSNAKRDPIGDLIVATRRTESPTQLPKNLLEWTIIAFLLITAGFSFLAK